MKKTLLISLALISVVMAGMAWAAEEKKAEAPAATPAMGFTIDRMEMCTGVENNEPVGAASSFPASQEKAYCFLEIKDVAKETSIIYVWKFGGKEMLKMPQTVKALSKYRTWAYKNFHGNKGEWTVEIQDASGKVLKTAGFKVE
jgi:hypothetical protein